MSLEEREYRTAEIATIIGRSVNKTNSYINNGYLVQASIDLNQGYSSRRRWSYLDVIRFLMISYFDENRIKPIKLGEIGKGMTDERLARDRTWVLDGLNFRDDTDLDIDIWNVPPDKVALSVLNFGISPVKVVVSMAHMHELAESRISERMATDE